MPLDGYILNILMQAATYAVAVLGMTVVLGYAGRSILRRRRSSVSAPTRGARHVGLPFNFWHCLVGRLAIAPLAGGARPVPLRLGGHYLAMVTISFQQIVRSC